RGDLPHPGDPGGHREVATPLRPAGHAPLPPREGADRMSEHDDVRDWDGAYLLGALSAGDRRTFERHLATCDACTASVAELAALPGLLAQVPASEAEVALQQETHSTPDLLPSLVDHVARRRRRSRRWVLAAAIGGVAAALVLG